MTSGQNASSSLHVAESSARGSLCSRRAFTVIELLVVMAILAILTAILVPIVSGAAASGRATASMSNLRQWGIALNMYVEDHNGTLPWEGDDSVAASISARDWWANALPRYVGMDSYSDLVASGRAPLPPDRTIFLDAAATVPPNAPYQSGDVPFFFCYVPNSKLDANLPRNGRVKARQIERPDATIFMVEMRTHKDELPTTSPFYNKSLDRAKADWQRFANRHNKGGHMAFADGHVAHVTQEKATTQTGGDYNQADLIWNPFGVAR